MQLIFIIIDICFHYHYHFSMYICLCNNLTSKKIDEALRKGISCSEKIHDYFNCKPKCGKCLDFMKVIVQENTKHRKVL